MYQKSAFYDGNSKKQSGLKFCKFKVNSKFEWQNQKCFEHFLTHKLICKYILSQFYFRNGKRRSFEESTSNLQNRPWFIRTDAHNFHR